MIRWIRNTWRDFNCEVRLKHHPRLFGIEYHPLSGTFCRLDVCRYCGQTTQTRITEAQASQLEAELEASR